MILTILWIAWNSTSFGNFKRKNWIIFNMLTTMLKSKKMPKDMWVEVVTCAIYLSKCSPIRSLKDVTPQNRMTMLHQLYQLYLLKHHHHLHLHEKASNLRDIVRILQSWWNLSKKRCLYFTNFTNSSYSSIIIIIIIIFIFTRKHWTLGIL